MSVGAAVTSGASAGAAFGPWGAAIGGIVGGIGGLLASKQKAPQQADYKPVNIAEEQKRAIDANLANFDAAATLTGKVNSRAQSEAQRLLEQAIPGFSAIQQRMLAQANQDLDAQTTLPAEVQDQIARFAAEKGVTRGTAGNFNAFNLVKDFGFNLVDWQQASRARALNTLSSVYGMAPRVNVMSPMAMMVDPNTALAATQRNNEMQYRVDQSALDAQMAARNQNAAMLGSFIQSAGSQLGSAYAQSKDIQWKATEMQANRDWQTKQNALNRAARNPPASTVPYYLQKA